ncbi:MAG: drug/metabolite transporter (DMT)-like permease [Gammaproteobacteria bacterium]|jgi:drug/metabolite transporter (DMT)-like permease
MKSIIGPFWRALPLPMQATVLMTIAMAFFTSMSIFIRLSAQEIHVLQVVFFRNFLAFLLLLPWLMNQGFATLRTKRFGLLLTRSTVNVVGMAAGFFSLTLIPLAEATVLGFTAPLWATIGAVIILREVIRLRRITALVFGFVGVVIVLRPGVDSVSVGAVLALSHAFLIAITTLIVKRLTTSESPTSIVIWMVLLQSPLSLLPALYVWEWPTLMTWVWLWCLAGAGTLGHLCWTRAFSIAEVSQLQPFEFIKLPMIAIFAYLVFAEQPTIWTWLGGIVIFASTAYISIREASLARQRAASA